MRRSAWTISGLLIVAVVVFVVFRQPITNWTNAQLRSFGAVAEPRAGGPLPTGTRFAAPWPTRPDEWTPQDRTPTASPVGNPPESRTPPSPLDRTPP